MKLCTEDLRKLADVLDEHRASPDLIFFARQNRKDVDVRDRGVILRALKREGWGICKLAALAGLTRQRVAEVTKK